MSSLQMNNESFHLNRKKERKKERMEDRKKERKNTFVSTKPSDK